MVEEAKAAADKATNAEEVDTPNEATAVKANVPVELKDEFYMNEHLIVRMKTSNPSNHHHPQQEQQQQSNQHLIVG